MIPRDRRQVGEPEVTASFPGVSPRTRWWFRAHRDRVDAADRGCWYFASLPASGGSGGRFDLTRPGGTCYWATTELAAARERLGRPGDLVAHDEVAGVVVTRTRIRPGRLADVLHADAARHGVTAELSAVADYRLTQRWGAAFASAGFGGVRYHPRFSSDLATAIALFGAAGSPRPARPVADSRPMAEVLVDHGYTVLATPGSADLGPLLD